MCLNRKVTGVDFDGGYADYIIASGGAACDRRRRRRCPQASRSRAAAASRGGACKQKLSLLGFRADSLRARMKDVPDASVDVAYCTVVFMHLCSDGGWKVFEDHRAFLPANRPPHMTHNSTPQEIETYLKRAGFSDVRVRTDDDWVRASGIKAP